MKVAVVHEWLETLAGREAVLQEILALYPAADLFTVVDFLDRSTTPRFRSHPSKTTFIQQLPGARGHFRKYLALMPLAIEQLDLRDYDLVLSSSHAVAKGVITGVHQTHISYVHTPARYAWDLQAEYLAESGLANGLKGGVARYLLNRFRRWDAATADRVDHYIANSEFVAGRIRNYYDKTATVIYPPVDTGRFKPSDEATQDYYIVFGRLVPYKRVPLIVEAFSRLPDRRLLVVGDGPEFDKVKSRAAQNVTFTGRLHNEDLLHKLQRARAFIFAALEDFGIATVEAQACGIPVIAYGRGGSAEIVRSLGTTDAPTGILFGDQNVESICQAVRGFERHETCFTKQACRENAERFSIRRFRNEYRSFVDSHFPRSTTRTDTH